VALKISKRDAFGSLRQVVSLFIT